VFAARSAVLVSAVPILALFPGESAASDRLFAYTYQTSVLEKGQVEIEPWFTYATGRDTTYTRLDHRLEFELGLGGHLQTSFYFNYKTEAFEDPAGGLALDSKFDGFSNEWKLQLSDPAADAIGFALYGEATAGADETELEGKLLLDKTLGSVLVALNGVYEAGWEQTGDGAEMEQTVAALVAATVEVKPTFHVGLEAREENVLEEGEVEHAILAAGPSLSFRPDAAWIALTVLPQITDLASGERNLDDGTKFEARLVFGVHL
jgi:hypothetical protein